MHRAADLTGPEPTDQEWSELAVVVHVIRPRLAARPGYAELTEDERADLELAELELDARAAEPGDA